MPYNLNGSKNKPMAERVTDLPSFKNLVSLGYNLQFLQKEVRNGFVDVDLILVFHKVVGIIHNH